MSLTNPNGFNAFWACIPKDIRSNIWLFPLRANKKNPDVPAGTCLKGNEAYRLSYSEALQRLKWGSNVGIYALPGGIMFLDLDVSKGKLIASQTFLDTLESNNKTLKVRTRNGGFQYYFLNDGKYANQLIKENNVVIGEFRTDWYYVVSVGSYVEPNDEFAGDKDGTYRIITEHAISQFQPFGEYFKTNDENKKKNEVKIFSQKTVTTDITYEKHMLDLEIKKMVKRKGTLAELRFLRCKYGKS